MSGYVPDTPIREDGLEKDAFALIGPNGVPRGSMEREQTCQNFCGNPLALELADPVRQRF